ncbi:MAG: signal peptidase I [Chloroflexi bacterium]|nr:signal peptidase I [Chloroflexota bacterium]
MTLRRILTLMAVAAIVAVIGFAAYAWANGVRFYAVESGSMAPAVHAGDLVIDLPTTPTSTYRIGDIITFHPTPGTTTTHRIAALEAAGIVTRGDANPSSDVGYLQATSIVGRVAAVVPFGGYVAVFFRQPAGVAALLLFLVAAAFLWHFIGGSTPRADESVDAAREASAPASSEEPAPDASTAGSDGRERIEPARDRDTTARATFSKENA